MNSSLIANHRYHLLLLVIITGYAALQIILAQELRPTYDEGINLQVAHLIAQGHEPYRQIFTLSSPLFVSILGWLGQGDISLVGGRFLFSLFGLLLLANTIAITRLLAGPKAGVGAGLLLAFTTPFLVESFQVVAVTPALSIATLALVLALRNRQPLWIFLAGLAGGSSLFISTSALATVLMAPLLLLLLADPRTPRFPAVGLWGAGLLISLGVGVALYSPDIMLNYVLKQWLVLWQNLPLSQPDNFEMVGQALALNVWAGLLAIYALASVYRQPRHPLWIVLVWGLLNFVWLMLQTALHPPDLLILAPPLAIMAGWGLVDMEKRLAAWSKTTRFKVALGAALPVFLLLAGWQQIHQFNLQGVDTADDVAQRAQWPEIADFIQQHTAPDDCVIIDNAALAVVAQRYPAPPLVGLTRERLESKLLTDAQLEALAREYECRMVVFSKREYTLPLAGFEDWVKDHYPNKQEFIRTDIYYTNEQ